jgi:hypothetical protein
MSRGVSAVAVVVVVVVVDVGIVVVVVCAQEHTGLALLATWWGARSAVIYDIDSPGKPSPTTLTFPAGPAPAQTPTLIGLLPSVRLT